MFLAPLATSLSTAIGAGTAATSASSLLSVAGAVASGVSGIAQAAYQSRVASNNARIAEENAVRVRQAATVRAQEQDFAARDELGAMAARAGASGLSGAYGSKQLQRKSGEQLAARDRAYTVYQGETEAAGYRQQAQDERAAGKSGIFFSALEGIGGVGSTLISNASKVNRRKARALGAS